MAKQDKKSKKPNTRATSKKKRVRKGIPLKRYNKILSTVVKDYKKKGLDYDLKDIRKGVSAIYPKYKDIAPSRISVKSVKEDFANTISIVGDIEQRSDVFRIQATDVPRIWFDKEFFWFEMGERILDFNQTYPEIPIVIKTAQNELRIKGNIGQYTGSIIQEFMEELREEFQNSSAGNSAFLGNASYEDMSDKQYAFWGTLDAELPPRMITDYQEVDRDTQIIVEEREEELKQKKKTEKKAKQEAKKLEKSKEKKAKPPTKKKEEPKPQPTPLADKNKAKELLLEEFKLGIWTKEEYREKANAIDNMYGKGGTI